MCLNFVPVIVKIVLFGLTGAFKTNRCDCGQSGNFGVFIGRTLDYRSFVPRRSTQACVFQSLSDTSFLLSEGGQEFDTAVNASPRRARRAVLRESVANRLKRRAR